MKKLKIAGLLTLAFAFIPPLPAVIVTKDQCLAPYFHVESAGEISSEQFPLRNTKAKVNIAGVIAEVTIIQTYVNTGSKTIEAQYIFPASTRAAVHGMEMKIGERLTVAKIAEKEKAKKTYEKAKAEKKSAALLEQKRPNVFEMNVANILPGDNVEVTLRYSEILRPEDATYEFVYPTVVAPRYSNKTGSSPDATDHAWVQNPYLGEGQEPSAPTGFQFDLELNAGLPIASLTCPSHQSKIDFQSKEQASVALAGNSIADRDVIIRYQLAGKEISAGLLLDKGSDENFFLLNVQPPARVKAEHIPPREYIFVMDVSGSMKGFPLDVSKRLFRNLTKMLREEDSFNIMTFAGSSAVLAEASLPATKHNIRRAIDFFDDSGSGGGTELVSALTRAIRLPGDEDTSRSVLIITDGHVSMEADAFQLVRDELGRANLFAFGIGSSVNRHLIEGLARVGLGEPFVVTSPSESDQVSDKLKDYIASPVLTDIKVSAEGMKIFDLEPGHAPDVFAARPLTLTGRWTGKDQGKIVISGKTGGGKTVTQEFDLAEAMKEGTENPALPKLWARERVRALADYAQLSSDDEAVKEVTNIGLTYSLLTPYTSFVAVDNIVRESAGDSSLVNQPLPLPKGMKNSSIGAVRTPVTNGSVPEPGTITLLLVALLSLNFMRSRRPY